MTVEISRVTDQIMGLVILTGASGAGKTSIAQEIKQTLKGVQCLFFDSIGVPSLEEMIAKYGSGEGWQRAMTLEWLRKIGTEYDLSRPILFEGQARISFICEALETYPIANASVILVDCSDDIRSNRLKNERNQPELANAQMMNWAAYLRAEAKTADISILDTSRQSLAESVEHVKMHLLR
jgi:dephospho-CoA kinase